MNKLFLSLMLVAGVAAHAGQTLKADSSDYGADLSTIEKLQILTDKQIDTVKVASLDNGPASNPVSIVFMLLSADQRGDNANFDLYRIPGSFDDNARTAQIAGDFLIITTVQANPDANGDFKDVPKTLKIQIKHNGKQLAAPILE